MSRTPRIIQIMPGGGWRWREIGSTHEYQISHWALVEWTNADGSKENEVEPVDVRHDGALYGLLVTVYPPPGRGIEIAPPPALSDDEPDNPWGGYF